MKKLKLGTERKNNPPYPKNFKQMGTEGKTILYTQRISSKWVQRGKTILYTQRTTKKWVLRGKQASIPKELQKNGYREKK